MMTAELVLSKRPVLRFTADLFFLLKIFSSHIYRIMKELVFAKTNLSKLQVPDVNSFALIQSNRLPPGMDFHLHRRNVIAWSSDHPPKISRIEQDFKK